MPLTDLLSTPAVGHALVVGAFGGVGLVLTVLYSRRGPTIYRVYAALLVALALELSRYATLPYGARYVAASVGFVAASAPFLVATFALMARRRRRLRAQGRLPAHGGGPGVLGTLGALAFLAAIGAIVSAGVAYVTG